MPIRAGHALDARNRGAAGELAGQARRMTRLEAIWDQLFPPEQTRLIRLLVEKVIVSPDNIEVRLRPSGIEEVVLDLQPFAGAEEVTA